MTAVAGKESGGATPLRLLAMAAGVVAFAALVALGTWQLQRLAWKEALIQTISQRVASVPRPLAEIEGLFARTGDVDYWPVEATGRFLNDAESHFFATWQGATGYYIYTPFELPDRRVILVNRGFVPFDSKDPATRPEGQISGEIAIRGLARNPLAEKPSALIPDNDLTKNIFYWKDLGAMAGRSGLAPTKVLPFFIDLATTEVPGGLPVGGVTMIEMPNSHLQYAVTWYGLAAALLGVYVVWYWRARKAV